MTGPGQREQELASLVQQHFERAVRFCSRMLGSAEAGEEVAQQAFVRLYERKTAIGGKENPQTYLFALLRNACLDHLRGRKREQDKLARAARQSLLREDLGNADRTEIEQALLAAVGELPEGQREVVLLRFYEGLPLADVAGATGQTLGAAAMKLARAKAALHEKLGRLPALKDYTRE